MLLLLLLLLRAAVLLAPPPAGPYSYSYSPHQRRIAGAFLTPPVRLGIFGLRRGAAHVTNLTLHERLTSFTGQIPIAILLHTHNLGIL